MQDRSSQTEALLNENIIDLGYYWQVLRRNLGWILILVVVSTTGAYLVSQLMKPMYRATATLLIDSKDSNVVAIQGLYGDGNHAKEYYLTQYEILQSRKLADRLVKRLDLTHSAEFDPRQQPGDWIDNIPWLSHIRQWFEGPPAALTDTAIHDIVVAKLSSDLDVEPVNNTQLININFETHDPVLATKLANTLADLYIQNTGEVRADRTKQAAGWLTGQLQGLEQKLKASEARLQAYRDKEALVEISGVNTLNAQELDQLTQHYVTASNTRTQAQTLYEQVRSAGPDPSVDQLLQLPSIQRDEQVKSLSNAYAEAERNVAELSKRYGPKHPKMINAMAQEEQAHAELASQVKRVAYGIEADYQAAVENEKAVADRLARAKKEAQSVNRKEFRLSELQRQVDTNRQLYNMFLTRAKEAGAVDTQNSADARVVDPAQIPNLPVSPKVTLIVLAAMAASLGVGIMLAFLRDALDHSLRHPSDIEMKLHLRLLAFLPKIKTRTRNMPMEGYHTAGQSNFAEAIRSLRTGLMLANLQKPYQTVMVTSSLPGEGKSTVALNLAESLGQMERVLLVEADLRQPVLVHALKLQPDAPGLTNLITGCENLRSCIRSIPAMGIDVLVAGIPPGNPQELLSSRRVLLLLQALSQHYDRIIIDTPPMQLVSDALLVAACCDGVIFVAKAGSTQTREALDSIRSLREVNALIAGAVLNQVNLRKSGYKGYYTREYPEPRRHLTAPVQARHKQSSDLALH